MGRGELAVWRGKEQFGHFESVSDYLSSVSPHPGRLAGQLEIPEQPPTYTQL